MREPRVSIVFPTYNRTEKLNRLLQSIAESSLDFVYEVMVVDDSNPATAIDPINESAFKGNLVILSNKKRVFNAKARNQGWRMARGEYVFFVDDDNILSRCTVQTLVEELGQNPKIGALMPIVYYAKRPGLVWVYATPFSPGRWHFNLIGRNIIEERKPDVKLLPADALPNAFIVRKRILEEVGGFDEELPMSNSADFCQRTKKAGYEVFALTTACTYHDVALPSSQGYWAEHAYEDIDRRYFDVRDWFLLSARLHRGESMLLPRLLLRGSNFLIPGVIGVLLQSSRRRQNVVSIFASMLRGVGDGLKLAACVQNESSLDRSGNSPKDLYLSLHRFLSH